MFKKILIVALFISVCLNGFSQKKDSFDSEKAAIEAAKSKVCQKLNDEVLSRFKESLNSDKGNKPDLKKGIGESNQFLCQSSKIAALDKNGNPIKNATQLKPIYKKLKSKDFLPSSFIYSNKLTAGNAEIEKTDKNNTTYRIPVYFNATTSTPKIGNNAKYSVTFFYTFKLNKKYIEKHQLNSNGKKDKNLPKIKITEYNITEFEFKNSSVKEVAMFDEELESMKKEAANKIGAWYKAVPSNLDSQYSQYLNKLKSIDPGNSKINPKQIQLTQNGKTYIAKFTGNPIAIVYKPEIEESLRYLYTDPEAKINITPTFTIAFDNNKKVTSEKVTTEYTIEEAVPDPVKKTRYESALNNMNVFCNSLSEYVADNNKENKEKVISMFIDSKNDEVAVSHRSKYNNKERIDHRKAEKYIQRLKGTNLSFTTPRYIDSFRVETLNNENRELGLNYDSNLYTVMFDVIQQYDGKNYKDNTDKIVIMKKQDNDSYLIEKIIVVPNSTSLVE